MEKQKIYTEKEGAFVEMMQKLLSGRNPEIILESLSGDGTHARCNFRLDISKSHRWIAVLEKDLCAFLVSKDYKVIPIEKGAGFIRKGNFEATINITASEHRRPRVNFCFIRK